MKHHLGTSVFPFASNCAEHGPSSQSPLKLGMPYSGTALFPQPIQVGCSVDICSKVMNRIACESNLASVVVDTTWEECHRHCQNEMAPCKLDLHTACMSPLSLPFLPLPLPLPLPLQLTVFSLDACIVVRAGQPGQCPQHHKLQCRSWCTNFARDTTPRDFEG